jgi:hypothetical protein
MAEIRAAIILDQHLASTTPEARTRRPTLAHTWPLHPLSLDTRSILGTQLTNTKTSNKAILIAPSDNRNPIHLEDLYAWARPLNEPRHKGQSLWIGSTILRTKMPPLNPPPLNTSPLHDLDATVSQQDVRHVRISIQLNPTPHEILRKFLGNLHCPTSLTTDDGALQAKYHTSSQARSIVHTLITFCANTFDPKMGSQTYAALTTPTTTLSKHLNLDDLDHKSTSFTLPRTSLPAWQHSFNSTTNSARTSKRTTH